MIKSGELKAIDIKSQLADCYEEVQPFLGTELEKLRIGLIALPVDAAESAKLAVVQRCVESLNVLSNKFDENEDIDGGIDADERVLLCEIIYTLGDIVGLDASAEHVDHWRVW
ncbi:MAG TPA: hypothetical protein PKD54_09105 [Pirellulaceae bacterium]|nr:hypothetical protein [Pirellulaceae bacterium]